MNIQSRLEALERLAAQRARKQAERGQFCGVIPIPDSNGTVFMCWDIPCDRVPTWAEFGSLSRRRATCLDVAECEFALVCRAGQPREHQHEDHVL